MEVSFKRIKSLIQRDFIIYKKPLTYGLISLIALIIFIAWLPTTSGNFNRLYTDFWFGWYITFLLGGGLLLCSIIFWEFKSATGRMQYLSLPASNFEKLFSRSLYVLIFYPLLLTGLFLMIYSLFRSMGISDSFIGHQAVALKYIWGAYLSLGSTMLIYAIVFNNYVGPKSFIVSGFIYLVCVIIAVLIFRIIMSDFFVGMTMTHDNVMIFDEEKKLENMGKTLLPLAKFILWVGLPVYLWTVAYFKMTEKQV
ncbi:MAG: hypothetical protein HKN51_13220 [Saprospiraceae bacterium]|nr:hypothetical protein [Saprospiraceae bacterium]